MLSNSIYPCMNGLRYESKCKMTDGEMKTEQCKNENSLELTFLCVCVRVCVWGLHALLQWPETTFIPAATTAALHTSHLQRLASIVETCTIFN